MPEAMDMLLKITDERHLLYGSDFPYVPAKTLLGKKAALDNELANRQWLAKSVLPKFARINLFVIMCMGKERRR